MRETPAINSPPLTGPSPHSAPSPKAATGSGQAASRRRAASPNADALQAEAVEVGAADELEVGVNTDSSGANRAQVAAPTAKRRKGANAPYENDFDRLFLEWKRTGDPQLRDRLILMHRHLVSYLARRFTDRGEMFEDITQQGLIGLINALDHFDPKRGVRFATFATPTIIGEIRRYFRDKTWSVRVPRRLQELHQVINRKIEGLTQELDRSPTYAEIARSLNIEVEQVVEALEMTYALEPASLDEPSSGSDDEGAPISDVIGSEDPSFEHWNEYHELQSALEQLPERQRIVLKLAYFEGYSQAEIAREIKVSPMHVSRLQRRALSQLRELMEEQS